MYSGLEKYQHQQSTQQDYYDLQYSTFLQSYITCAYTEVTASIFAVNM